MRRTRNCGAFCSRILGGFWRGHPCAGHRVIMESSTSYDRGSPMGSEILIDTTSHETRVALLENGSVTELYVEREKDKGIVGNIYKGIVTKILPGMQAAFVDLGLRRAGFLYVADVEALDSGESLE